MNKIEMSIELLNVIHAVLDYKRHRSSHHLVFPGGTIDTYAETKKYFDSLPLPEGLKHSVEVFDKILIYGRDEEFLEKLDNTEYTDLKYYFF